MPGNDLCEEKKYGCLIDPCCCLLQIKTFLLDSQAFGNFSFYPDALLSPLSIQLLDQHHAELKKLYPDAPLRVNRWCQAPFQENYNFQGPQLISQFTVVKLMEAGLSKSAAELCHFLVQNRDVFGKIHDCGWFNRDDGRAEKARKWNKVDFFDRYYTLVRWVFNQQVTSLDLIRDIPSDLLDMTKFLPDSWDLQHKAIKNLSALVQQIGEGLTFYSFFKQHNLISKDVSNIVLEYIGYY